MKDTLGRVMVLAASGAGAVIAICGGAYLGLVYLFDGLGTSKIALLVLGMMCASVGAVLLVLFILRSVWSIKHEHTQPKPQESISAPYRVVQPPQIQPPQQRVYVPSMIDNGQARPLRAGIELTSMGNDGMITVRLIDAVKFAQLPTPARHEWQGKKETYGLLMRWYGLHGLLVSEKGGGGHWHEDYPLNARMDWLRELAGGRDVLPFQEMSDERS